jgi:hypothetical protein
VLFITLEITVSALMVFEVLLRMMAYKRVRLPYLLLLLLPSFAALTQFIMLDTCPCSASGPSGATSSTSSR